MIRFLLEFLCLEKPIFRNNLFNPNLIFTESNSGSPCLTKKSVRSDSGVGESIKSDNDDLPNYGVAGAHASATMYPPIDQPSSKLPIIDLETMSPQTVHGSMSPSHNYSSPDKPPKPETASNSPPTAPNSTSANISKTGKISSAINLTPVMPSPGPTVRQRISNWMRSADKHPVDKREVVKLMK